MRTTSRALALFFAAVLFLSALCGCGKEAAEPASSAPESESSYYVDPDYAVDTEGELPEVPEDFLHKAIEAYSWFEICLLDPIDNIPAKTKADTYLVEEEQFHLFSDFRDYLLGLFSPAIVNELLSRGYYIEENGYTYVWGHPRSSDKAVIDVDFGEGVITGRKLIYTVTVTFGDMQTLEPIDTQVFEFVAEPVNGRFVFTEFPYFY